MSEIKDVLTERGSRYGKFIGHAEVTQRLKRAMYAHPKYFHLGSDHREALEMIVHKIGRIINGDPNYDDSWVDIAGYAQLIVERIRGNEL